jgi:small subunit ribosomal protein S2
MAPFIFGKRNLIHIIDVKETVRGLIRACHFLGRIASTGEQILFVGTKRQIKAVVEAEATRCGMPYVTERWIGGTLTNYQTIRARLSRLEELERMEADGSMELLSKKLQSMLRREMRKIKRNLDGIRTLGKPPAAMVLVDPRREQIALHEAEKMNIPTVCLLDTDCDPDLVDIPIPGNDDAMRSVQVILSRLSEAIIEGRANMNEQDAMAAKAMMAEQPERGRDQRDGRREGGRGRGDGGRGRYDSGAGRSGGGRRAGGRFSGSLDQKADVVTFGGKDEATPAGRADQKEGPEATPGPASPAPDSGATPPPAAP